MKSRGRGQIRAAGQAGILALVALAGGCADRPRDPDGTTERIRSSQTLLVGEIAGATRSPEGAAVLSRVADRLGARVERVSGNGEDLLERLEKGELDIVYGEFAMKSPWARHVHFGAALGPRETVGKDERVPRFAYRHGENGWIMLVEDTIR